MAWSDPGDFTSGQILTAAQMDAVREAMFFGQATFTNEAARDAAIPATGITLQEGMRAYLTAPTVPAASGSTTASTCLFERAKQAALRTKWAPDPDALETQIGTIIYRFEKN